MDLRRPDQQAFGLVQMAAGLFEERHQLALEAPRRLQLCQKRGNRLGPPGVCTQITNMLSPVGPPAQLVVRSAPLAEFLSDKALARQCLEVCRRQAQAGQPVAVGLA